MKIFAGGVRPHSGKWSLLLMILNRAGANKVEKRMGDVNSFDALQRTKPI
jgi:hypothetical protein